MPSIGSAGHANGECRPCTHSWRPQGCSKGWSCTYCHLCGEDELKQKKREKIVRLRDERRQKRVDKVLADRVTAQRSRVCPVAGEFTITYSGASQELIEVNWPVDLRRLRHHNRCGILRRFPLRIHGFEAPFLLTIAPAGTTSFSPFSTDLMAAVQLKCVDTQTLSVGCCRVGIAIVVGTASLHKVSDAHDFVEETTCPLTSALDLTTFVGTQQSLGADVCVVKLFLTPP